MTETAKLEALTAEALKIADQLDEYADIDAAEGGTAYVIETERRAAVLLRALSSLSPPTGTGEPLTFGYTNWRGEYAERTAIPLRIERKESEWHGPGLHYVMVAFDVEKQAERDFLLTDMGRFPSPPEAE